MQPSRFGPYQIIRRLGKSMNDVYLALDTRENRQAALKLIPAGPDAVSKLVMESERRGAAIQQKLRALDPRVIEVYDYGDLDGYFFIAMQYVEGRNLADVLSRDGRLSALRAARIALEICRQLEKFHTYREDAEAAPVVHGDIKPSNVHLGPNDTVRLLDFGIAKTLRPDRDFTVHNFGSPSYCSPERLGRSMLDQQADLWALGATLYEMTAGSPPYQAENTDKLESLIRSRRPPRALPADCPAALKAVIRKALAPRAERRYASASAFASDLNAFLEGAETEAENERRRPVKPHPTRESAPAARLLRRTPIARIASAAGCIVAGMILFIGTSLCSQYWSGSRRVREALDWDAYQDLQWQFAFMGKSSPVEQLRVQLRAAYHKMGTEAAERGDWRAAERHLARAVELGAADGKTLARLAMAQRRWAEAVRRDPGWAEPHVALARASRTSPDQALSEIREAQRLGYTPGARDLEPIARAFAWRGFGRLESGDLSGARLDFDAASALSSRLEAPDLRAPPAARKPRPLRATRRGAE